MKTFRKISIFILISAMTVSLSVPALAATVDQNDDETITPQYVGTQTTHSWEYVIGEPTEKTSGSWKHIYTGEPATRDGEYDTVSHSVTYGHSFSGSFGGQIKKLVQVDLSISFSKDETFGISKNSAPLKKGEYIKAYWIKNYDVYDVKQTDHQHTYGFEQQYSGGPYVKVDKYHDEVSHVTVSKAIQPKIKIEYWKDGKKVRSINGDDLLERVEYYQMINGEYQLISSEII